MARDLEAPCRADSIDWSRLYRARGDEVVANRPYFTGDVFESVEVWNPDGSTKRKNVMIVQHPCAMRTNGGDLVPKLLVTELRNHRVLSPEEWTGYRKNMPLPDLIPTITSGRRSQAASHRRRPTRKGHRRVYGVAPRGGRRRDATADARGRTAPQRDPQADAVGHPVSRVTRAASPCGPTVWTGGPSSEWCTSVVAGEILRLIQLNGLRGRVCSSPSTYRSTRSL